MQDLSDSQVCPDLVAGTQHLVFDCREKVLFAMLRVRHRFLRWGVALPYLQHARTRVLLNGSNICQVTNRT